MADAFGALLALSALSGRHADTAALYVVDQKPAGQGRQVLSASSISRAISADPEMLQSFGNTLFVSVLGTVITLGAGLPLCLCG